MKFWPKTKWPLVVAVLAGVALIVGTSFTVALSKHAKPIASTVYKKTQTITATSSQTAAPLTA